MLKIQEIKDVLLDKEIKALEDSIKYRLSKIDHKIGPNKLTFKSGKRIRPLLMFLLYKMIYEDYNQKIVDAATSIELMHIASMIHDDVIDSSTLRHGISTINVSHNNQIAVLCGDAMVTESLLLLCDIGDITLTRILIEAANHLATGELIQMKHKHTCIDLATYMDIINMKTGSLFIATGMMVANIANLDNSISKKIHNITKNIGIILQLKDDMIDYWGNVKNSGKPKMNDIAEHKMTIPLIHAIAEINESDLSFILSKLDSKSDISEKDKNHLFDIVNGTQSYKMCLKMIDYHIAIIKENLESFNNKSSQYIEMLIQYIKNDNL